MFFKNKLSDEIISACCIQIVLFLFARTSICLQVMLFIYKHEFNLYVTLSSV